MSRQHRSMMREMMGRDPFAEDPFFRDPFGMMGMDGGMVGYELFAPRQSFLRCI